MAEARHGGVTVHYQDRGNREGEPLVLIMGLGGSGASWFRMLPHLESDHRTLVIDNRGTVPAQLIAAAGHRAHGRLKRLEGVPVTVIHGEEDRLIPVGVGRDLASRIPGAQFVELDQCGHVMSTDAEERYAEVLLAHLARAQRS